MSANSRYVLVGSLTWRELDGDWVVFCSASGALQCVDVVGLALLTWLEEGPASVNDLTARLAAAARDQLPTDGATGVADWLHRWQQTGWLELADA